MQRQLGFVHQDTVPIPRIHEDPTSGTAEPEQRASALGPVFVDTSGRRQRRIRRLGRLLVVPAAVYVTLLVSTLLGGPTIHSPLVPLPAAPGAGVPVGATGPHGSAQPSAPVRARPGPVPQAGATAAAATTRPAAPGSTTPSATVTAVSTSPTATASSIPVHGRSSHSAAPPGASHRPGKKS
jgi:hypothetical protein